MKRNARQFVGRISGWLGAFLLAVTAGAVEVPRNFSVVSNDAVTGSATLTKTGGGILYLGSSEGAGNTFNGDIVVGVDGGTLRITGNANAPAAPAAARQGLTLPNLTTNNTLTVKRGGILFIEDNVSTTTGYVANRFGSAGNRPAVRLEGGSLTWNGANATATMPQTLGHLKLASGPATLLVTRNHASSTPQLIFSSLLLEKGAFANYTGTGLGTAAANVSQILFGTPPAVIGGGGIPNTTTMSIVPRARSTYDLVYYGDYGIRPLTAAEYLTTTGANDINAAGATENVKLTGTTTPFAALGADKAINALVINANIAATWPLANKLTLTSGQLIGGVANQTLNISSGVLTAGAGADIDLDVTIGLNTTTIGAVIADNGAGSVTLVKNGGGTLTLGAATDNTYSGGTVINEGTLTTGSTGGRRYLSTGPVTVDNAFLSLYAPGATANSAGSDYTAVNGAQFTLGTVLFTGDDTFNVAGGSVLSGNVGSGSTFGYGLPGLDRGIGGGTANVTLAADAIVARGGLTTPLNLGTDITKHLGTAADLYYGLWNDQNNIWGSINIGSGTAFKGISTDRAVRNWLLGTINVAAGTSDIYLQGLIIPTPFLYTLTVGNGLTAGGPVISLAGAGTVNANVIGPVTLNDDAAVYGDTSAGRTVNFKVAPGATLTVSQSAGMGSGTGIATAQVEGGGLLAIAKSDSINGDTRIGAGGRLTANLATGLTGIGALTFESGSILHLSHATGFTGAQADAATIAPGTIVRLAATYGTPFDLLDSRLQDTSPIYELYGASYWPVNPATAGTTILTLNRDAATGLGGMLVNDNSPRPITAVANGVIVIGGNGGTIAATTNTMLTVPQPIALGANALTIGATNRIDEYSLPKHGIVALTAGAGFSTALPGSSITVVPGAQLNNSVNSLPDAADLVVDGIFLSGGVDTIGSLAGSGLVNLPGIALTVGRNNNSTTFAGTLTGTGAFAKSGTGRLDLTGDITRLTHSGAITVNEGTLALSGAGKFSNNGSSITINTNATLLLDNSGTLTTGRISTKPLVLTGGTLSLIGNGSAATTESVGAVTPGQGDSTIRVSGGTAGKAATLVLASGVARLAGATLHFEGIDANNIIKYTSAPFGYANGILPYGFVGSNFAVTPANTAISAYTAYTTGDLGLATAGSTVNFSLSGAQTACDNKNVNSVKMSGGLGIVVNATRAVTFTSGSIINDGGGDITGAGTIAASGSSAWTILNTGNMTISTAMTGTGGLVKLGAGRLTIGSATTFSGNTTITDGTLAYGIDEALFTQDIYVDGGGILDFGAYNDLNLGSVNVKNGRIIATGATAANSIVQAASKTITLGGGPSGSKASIDTGAGLWKMASNLTFSETGDPDGATLAGKFDLNGGNRTFTVGNSLAAAAAFDLDVPAVITGLANNGITKAGAGVMRLSATNTFDGPVNVTGTLRLSNPRALGLPSTTRALTINAASSLVFDGAGGNIAVPANYTPLTLSGTGDTMLGPVSGALVSLTGTNSVPSAVSLAAAVQIASLKAGDKLTLAGNIANGANGLTVAGDGDVALDGVLGNGAGTLTKNGSGTLILNNANTFTGLTTVNAGGAINVRHNTGLGTTAAGVVVNSFGTLQLQGGLAISAEALTLNGTGVAGSGALRNISGANSYGGAITLGSTGVRINADAGLLSVDVASGNAIAGNTFGVSFGGAGDITVADPIATTTGTLNKDGGGTLTLAGVNTYTGATTVDGGTLNVNGSLIAGSAVRVNSGAALGGTGTCLGAVTVVGGGTVASGVKGTAGGTLTVASLNLGAGSACAFEIASTPANDKIVVSGAGGLTIAPGTGVYLYDQGTTNALTTAGSYNLIQYSGTLNGSVANLSVLNPQPGKTYQFSVAGGWIIVRADLPEVAALPVSNLTVTGARMNGQVVNAGGAGNPSVYVCWDTTDKGVVTTSAWAHVDLVGTSWGAGQSFGHDVAGLAPGGSYTYRCFVKNTSGTGWSAAAVSFRSLYPATVVNQGAVMTGATTALLRGAVTDTGGEAPGVWFLYWLAGGGVTNVIGAGTQTGACSTPVSGLTANADYGCRLMASNAAGTVWSAVLGFNASTNLANIYTGVTGGAWETPSNWSLQSVPALSHTVVVPAGKTVAVNAEGVAGSLLIATNAAVSIGGATTVVHWRAPLNAARTDPVGLQVAGNLTVGGSLMIGGLNQACPSYLTVGGNLTISNALSAVLHALLAVYAGPVNGTASGFKTGGAQVTVGGTTSLKNAWIYPYCHQSSGGPAVFDLQDAVIASDSGFNATGRGYALVGGIYYGPGAPTANATGGSHGGLGGSAVWNSTYGFAYAPFRPGSPGRLSHVDPTRGNGGGTIRIAGRAIQLNGQILAEGSSDTGISYGGGAGGAVWVTCSNFMAGAGAKIRVVGGTADQHGDCGGGGGGRVTIMTDSPTAEQIESLYNSGTCDDLIVVTGNMLDPLTSPYPTLAAIYGGTNYDTRTVPTYVKHGQPGTAVWLRNKGDNHQAVIRGTPAGMSSTPPYGVNLLPDGENVFSAISPSQVYGAAAGTRLACTGYSWSNALAQTGSGAAATVTLDLTNDVWLTWNWGNLEYRLEVRSGGNGTVVPNYNEWNAANATVTLTAQPDPDCTFLYWVGDVPYADRLNADLALTMDRPRMVIACFTAAAPEARTLTWNGGSGVNDWFAPANWDGSAIPGIHDRVRITSGQSSVAYPVEMTVASLTVAQSGKLFLGGTGSAATACTPLDPLESRPYGLTVTGGMTVSNTAQFAMGGQNGAARVDLAVGGNLLLDHTATLVMYAAYTGPSTDLATFQNGGARVSVGGTTTLNGSSWIHPVSDQRSGSTVIFDLRNLTIAEAAGFNADYRGFGRQVTQMPNGLAFEFFGPGIGLVTADRSGGSYGGQGGYNTLAACGYPCAPFYPGSSGRSWQNTADRQGGGGAIRIRAATVVLNGTLKATGYGAYQYGGGSGGGIWVTCDTFELGAASALIANGGNGTAYGATGGGGGGRIAIGLRLSTYQIGKLYATGTLNGLEIINLSELPAFTGRYTVNGGAAQGGVPVATAGTAVLTIAPPSGTLIIFR